MGYILFMMKNMAKFKLCVAMVIFSTIGLLRKPLNISSGWIAFIRALLGAIILWIVKFYRHEKWDWQPIQKQFLLLCISGILLGGNWVMLFESVRYTYVSIATMCYYMAPVFMLILARMFFKEQIGLYKSFCMLVAFLGMILVSGIFDVRSIQGFGVLYGLASAFMYACVVCLNRKMKWISPNDRTLLQLSIAALTLFPYLLIQKQAIGDLNGYSILILIIAGCIHTGLAYVLYFGAVDQLDSSTVAILSYIDPILAILLSTLFLNETLSIWQWFGVACVIGGMFFSERKKHAQRALNQFEEQ